MRIRYFCVWMLAVVVIISGIELSSPAKAAGYNNLSSAEDFHNFFSFDSPVKPIFSDTRAAETMAVTVSMPSMTAPQGLVIIPVSTTDVTGLGVISYDLQVTFNPAVLAPASPAFDKAGTISNGMSIMSNTNFPGHLIVTAFQGSPLIGGGPVLFLRFNVIGSAGQVSPLLFENYNDPGSNPHPGFRYNEGDPAVIALSGSVTVATPTPTATATFTPTNTATDTPTATNTVTLTPTATNTATNTPTFSPTVILTNTPTSTSTATPNNTATATNTSTLTPTSTNTSTNTATSTPTPLGGPIPIALPNASALSGSVVTVPITVGDTTGRGIISYDLQVTFDPEVLTPATAVFDKTGTLSNGMAITPNIMFPGHLILTAFQANNLTGSGILLNLRFNVVGSPGQSSRLLFEDYIDPSMQPHVGFVFNEGDPQAEITDGSFTVSTPTPTATNTATSTATATDTPTFTPTSTATYTATSTATDTPTFTPTGTATNTSTPTSTATPTFTATFTPTPPPSINGTVTYGNAVGSPGQRFVSNVQIDAAGSPSASTVTEPPGPNAGTYSLSIAGNGPYVVTPWKTGGTNNAINSFDAARVAAHVTGVNSLSGNAVVAADVSGNGVVQSFDAAQIARFVTSSSGSGTTGTWKFFTVPNIPFPPGLTPTNRTYLSITSSLTGQDYTAILMGEVSGNWTNTGARPVNSDSGPVKNIFVRLPSLFATEREIIVPLAVDGVANKGIVSYEFNLRYDPGVIQPLANPVETFGTASRGLTAVTNASEPGLLRVAVYGALPIESEGVLLNLRFYAVGAAGSHSPLAWERIMFNNDEPRVTAVNGRVEIGN